MIPIKGGGLSPDFPLCAKDSSCYPLQATLFASFLSLLSSYRTIRCPSSVSPVHPNLAASQGKEKDNKMKPLSQKINKNKIKPLKGHVFERATVAPKKSFFFFWQKIEVSEPHHQVSFFYFYNRAASAPSDLTGSFRHT